MLKIHRILSRALTVAVRRDVLGRNIATLIDAPVAEETEMRPLTQEEARRVLQAATHLPRNGARWSVALALGLRQGEALGLRWSYLDLRTGEVRAWHQVQRSEWQHGCGDPNRCGVRWHRAPCRRPCRQHGHAAGCAASCRKRSHRCPVKTCDPKVCVGHARHCAKRTGGGVNFRPRKGRSKLTLHCPPQLLGQLAAHRKTQAAERLAAGERWHDQDLVFCRPNGEPIDRSNDWREWKALLRTASVPGVRVHDGRHTAATLLVEQGVHIRTVQEILGHSRITVTEKYTHVASDMSRLAADKISRALWE